MQARMSSIKARVNKVFHKDIVDVDAPGLEGYDGRGQNVGQQGESLVRHLGDVDHAAEEDIVHPDTTFGNE